MMWKHQSNKEVHFTILPFALAGTFFTMRLSHAVQSLLQEVFSKSLSHLSQRIHCKTAHKPFRAGG